MAVLYYDEAVEFLSYFLLVILGVPHIERLDSYQNSQTYHKRICSHLIIEWKGYFTE